MNTNGERAGHPADILVAGSVEELRHEPVTLSLFQLSEDGTWLDTNDRITGSVISVNMYDNSIGFLPDIHPDHNPTGLQEHKVTLSAFEHGEQTFMFVAGFTHARQKSKKSKQLKNAPDRPTFLH